MSKSGKDKNSGEKPALDIKSAGVGYGRPPAHTRFQKGKSGNPGGRPKGSKNLRTMICELADEEVTLVTPNGKSIVTIREAAARKYLEMMLKGEFKFFKAFHELEREWEALLKLEQANHREREVEALQGMILEMFGVKSEGVQERLRAQSESEK